MLYLILFNNEGKCHRLEERTIPAALVGPLGAGKSLNQMTSVSMNDGPKYDRPNQLSIK
jgi:hypothetical protein